VQAKPWLPFSSSVTEYVTFTGWTTHLSGSAIATLASTSKAAARTSHRPGHLSPSKSTARTVVCRYSSVTEEYFIHEEQCNRVAAADNHVDLWMAATGLERETGEACLLNWRDQWPGRPKASSTRRRRAGDATRWSPRDHCHGRQRREDASRKPEAGRRRPAMIMGIWPPMGPDPMITIGRAWARGDGN